MSTHRRIPTKNKTYRLPFAIRDTSLAPITANWTGKSCVVMTDFANVQTPTIVQIAGSHWGYVDITADSMNGDSVQVSISVTNTNAVPLDILISPADMSFVGTEPQDMDEANIQLFSRFLRKHSSDGAVFRVYAADQTTEVLSQTVSSAPLTVGDAFA